MCICDSEWQNTQKIPKSIHRSFWSRTRTAEKTHSVHVQQRCLQVLSGPLRFCGRSYTNSQSITGVDLIKPSTSAVVSTPEHENEDSESNSLSEIDSFSRELSNNSHVNQEQNSQSLTKSSQSKKSATISKYKTPIQPSFNLTPYVNQSETLSELVRLGVDLSEVEKKPGAADLLVRLNYYDLKPYLYFLHDCGIAHEKLGYILTKNPFIFRERIEDLQASLLFNCLYLKLLYGSCQ